MFSAALNHRSVAHTCTPNSRRRKIDEAARPQPRSNTLMPGRSSSAAASHSVSHREFAPPLAFAKTHSGWYCEARGNCSETSRSSDGIRSLPVLVENPQPDRRLVRRRPINPVLLVGRDVYEVARLHLDGGILEPTPC